MTTARVLSACLVAGALLGLAACTEAAPEAPRATTASPESAPPTERVVGPLSPDDSAALATMNDRLKAYLDLHLKIERSLPNLPNEASQQQIDQHQRGFAKALGEARATAKPGDIFTPEARPVITRLLESVFGGPDGKQIKASIMDENPVNVASLKIFVNSRYPDTVPLTSMPPQVLQTLPALTEDLEYRFVGDWLILLDTHAHMIADFIPDALPK